MPFDPGDDPPWFVPLSDGSIRNAYQIKILNMEPQPRTFRLGLSGLPGTVAGADGDTVPRTALVVDIEPDKLHQMKIYVRASKDDIARSDRKIIFTLEDVDGEETASYEANFEAP